MNEDDRDRLLAELIEKPEERKSILQGAELDERDRDDIAALVDTADLLWLSARGAPPLEDDPVAAMLGLVPDRECRLDSKALARARRRAGLTVSDVAERLRARGWEFQQGDVFRWETRSAPDVPPAVVQAIADIVGTPAENLIAASHSVSSRDHLAEVRRHPLFEQLVDRWVRVQRISRAVAIAELEGRMVATVHRGERPDTEQLLRSLDALVTSVEQADEESEGPA
jgi:transcriptional regulator with XRE-family HTH domain